MSFVRVPETAAMEASPLSRNGDFMKLWTGFTIARVGSQITVLALPLTAVLLLGAGATETGLLVPALVGRSRLVAANSRLQASNAVSQVAGPSLGGILVQALTAPVAMLCDA